MKNTDLTFPITKKKIHNHFVYAWWQYLLLVALSIFGWNILFTTTAYRVPETLKVEWFYDGYVPTTTADEMVEWMQSLEVLSGMEELSFSPVGYDESYGDMQLMVWSAAGEGDLYMLAKDRFVSMSEALVDLTPYIDSGALDVTGIDLTEGYVMSESGEKVLRGIPAKELTLFENYAVPIEGHALSVLYGSGNIDVTIALINQVLQTMKP